MAALRVSSGKESERPEGADGFRCLASPSSATSGGLIPSDRTAGLHSVKHDFGDVVYQRLRTDIEGSSLVRFLWLEIKGRCPSLINGGSSGLSAHEGDHRGLVHEAKFSMGPILFRIRVIYNGRIHEHASVRQDPVEISGQGTEIPENILPLIMFDPILNILGVGVPVGWVE